MDEIAHDQRGSPRFALEVPAALNHAHPAKRVDAELLDLSLTGCRVLAAKAYAAGTELPVKILGLEAWPARVVWNDAWSLGVEFDNPMHVAVVEHYARCYPREAA
jgi:hypothetical protein